MPRAKSRRGPSEALPGLPVAVLARDPTRAGLTLREESPSAAGPPARRARPGRQSGRGDEPRPRRGAAATPQTMPGVASRGTLSPEEHLARAMGARTPRGRMFWAKRGLGSRQALDRTTQAMLLRQLYLAHFEQRRFDEAHQVAEQALELDVLRDVVHQDAARASAALGDVDQAAGHLRLAARHGPPSRRAFHWWTLGSLYFNAARHQEAIAAFSRASRWGTRDKPLYQAHLAISRCASGGKVGDLEELFERLEAAPAGQGYGRFVLGHLAYYLGSHGDARRHLLAFVERTTSGRPATAIALDPELTIAKRTLAVIEDQGR